PLRRSAGRAGHHVLPRSERKRARVQELPSSRGRVRHVSRASVVVIGAGVMGTSAAYHLAARGWRNIVVLDRAPCAGLGSTGRATGGFRAQFSTPVNVKLSLLAREKLQRFEEETGVDPGFVQAGYLWLASSEAEREILRGALDVQHASGLAESYEAGLEEVAAINPGARGDG